MRNSDQKFEEYASFLAGESNINDKHELLERLKNDPNEKELVEKLNSFWKNYTPNIDSSDQIWKLTSQKLGLNPVKKEKTLLQNPFLRYAAAAVLLFSIGINSYFVASNWHGKNDDMIEYTAKTGEVKELTLPDGSKVWLNSESTLILPEQFKGNNRNVFLVGEAFFKVEKNPKKPFLVNTSVMTVKVLGTSFSVSNYQNDPEVRTNLVEGKVELLNKVAKGNDIVMKPSEEVVFTKANGAISIDEKSEALVAPWRQGRFRFYNTDLLSVAHQLERKFDCEFVFVDDEAETLRFTADFENEGLDEILELLNKAHSFVLKKAGKKYIISVSKSPNEY